MSAPPSPRTQRTSRSRVWPAVTAALVTMAVLFVAALVYELSDYADNAAPMTVVADADGPTQMQLVTVTKEQVTAGATPSVTLRVRNNSAEAVPVSVTLNSTASDVGGTLTAALTTSGAVVRSGALNVLRIPSFVLDADSTTPLTLDLDIDRSEIDALWDANGDITIAIGATS